MILLDDTALPDRIGNLEIVRRVGRRTITHAFHDIDGTHSLIRDWPPVMSALVSWVIAHGLPEGYDGDENAAHIASHVASLRTEEADRFAIESAGLSALTQMEWAIRRALQEGALTLGGPLTAEEQVTNDEILRRTWAGRERFEDLPDSARVRNFAAAHTPRLFQLYERALAKAGRDRNLAAARQDPAPWRVPGSSEFLRRLHTAGVKNYFVTGSVMSTDLIPEGMVEEVIALGFEVGPGKVIESAHGSDWNRKLPKDEVMRGLLADLGIPGEQVLIVGDGRSEVQAGVTMGAVVLSRLNLEAHRLRALHRELGTNYLVPDYLEPALEELLQRSR
jgi:phosphoglycolate phosphatase-like HAD superfamily hydrolase